MNEEKSSVPFLTLDPNATAAAVQEAPAAEEAKEEVTEEVQAAKLELESLTPAEQAAVKEFSEKINVLNTEQVMNYGSAAQKNISEFSDAALASVRTKDLGEVGHMLGDLVIELKGGILFHSSCWSWYLLDCRCTCSFYSAVFPE